MISGREDGSRSYTLMCRVVNDPYDVLGCWCDDEFFLSGTMLVEGANLLVNLNCNYCTLYNLSASIV